MIDDLGSRNGTLVNGEPVFDDHRLNHSDGIRIGSHDIVFVEEKPFSPLGQTMAGLKPTCPRCGAPVSISEAQCGDCGAALVPDNVCRGCHRPVPQDASFCPGCGAPLQRDDSTIPVELGGKPSGWTDELIEEVIDKALAAQRFSQAARLLDGKIREIDKKPPGELVSVEELARVCRRNLSVASGLRDAKRLLWVINRYVLRVEEMPEGLLEELEEAASGWYDIGDELAEYSAALGAAAASGGRSEFARKLDEMIGKAR